MSWWPQRLETVWTKVGCHLGPPLAFNMKLNCPRWDFLDRCDLPWDRYPWAWVDQSKPVYFDEERRPLR